MFEGVLNGLLTQFLAPYVDGLTSDKLRLRFGVLELTDLRLKSTLFAALGIDTLDVASGEIRKIHIELPLSALISGRIHVALEGFSFVAKTHGADGDPKAVAKSDSEQLETLRKSIQQRVETRVAQLCELKRNQQLVEAARAAGSEVKDKVSLAAKVTRQVLANVSVAISDISVSLQDPAAGSMFSFSLGSAFVRAPPELSQAALNDAVSHGRLCKEVAVESLSLDGGAVSCPGALLAPQGFVIRFTHDPEVGQVSVRFEFGSQSDKGLSLSEEQLRMIARTVLGLGREGRRLKALLKPPGTEELVDLRSSEAVDRTQHEFVTLLRRELREDLDIVDEVAPLEETQQWRLQVLRDVVPEELQSRWWVTVAEQLEAVEKKRAEEQARKGWFSRWYTKPNPDESEVSHAAAFEDLRAQAEQLSSLETPQKVYLEFVLVQFAIELNGRGEDENILRVAMASSSVNIDMQQQMDCRGVPSANVTVDLTLHRLSMTHLQETVLVFGSPDTANADSPEEVVVLPAVGMRLQNRLEASQTILHFTLNLQPVELFLVKTLVPRLLQFQKTAAAAFSEAEDSVATKRKELAEAADKTLDVYFSRGEEWLKSEHGQDVLDRARERVPDACEVQISLHGPRMRMPIPTAAASLHVSSGTLAVQTPHACNMAGIRLMVRLSEAAISVEDATARKHDVLSPAQLDVSLLVKQNSIGVDVRVNDVQVQMSPGVAQILLAAPKSLAESFSAQSPAAAPAKESQAELTDGRAPEAVVVTSPGVAPGGGGSGGGGPGSEDAGAAGEAKGADAEGSALASRANTYLAMARERAKRVEAPKDTKFRASFNLERLSVLLLRDCDVTPGVLRLETSVRSLRLSFADGVLEVPLRLPAGKDWGLAGLCDGREEDAKQSFHLCLDVFNIRTGRFEPLLEPFELTCELSFGKQSQSVHLFGQRPLLLDVTPSGLRLCSWYFPVLLTALSPPQAEAADSENDVPRATVRAPSFRVVNLANKTFVFRFPEFTKKAPIEIKPTGKQSIDLTDWIVPTRCDRISIVSQGREVELALDRLNAVMLPKDGAMPVLAQLLRPHMEGALLLISSPFQLANETSLSIGVRAAGASLSGSNCCAKAVLAWGGTRTKEEAERPVAGSASESSSLLLLPREVVHAPSACASSPVQPDGQPDITWELAAPDGLFSPILELPPLFRFASVSVAAGDNNFLAVRKISLSAPPAQIDLPSVTILPALHLISALPCGLEVEYRMEAEPANAARQTMVASFQENMLYNISTPGQIAVRVRMEGKTTWSDWAQLAIGNSSDTEGSTEEAELTIQEADRAPVAVVAQVNDLCRVAFCCPSWLIDRTGWSLIVRQHKRPLSDINGVALCPPGLDGFTLDAAGQVGAKFALPVGASEWARAALHDGRAVCVRSKALPAAETRPCTVRYLELTPWLVLHNAAARAIEVRIGDEGGPVVAIAPGASVAPQTPPGALRFRTTSSAGSVGDASPPAPSVWSVALHAEEHSKGAAHFALLASSEGKGRVGGAAEVSIWTAEVRPDQGVLCVVFEEGSSFSVANELQESIELRLRGLPPLLVSAGGSSQPIGWLDPMGEDANRRVELALPSSGETSGALDPCVANVTALGSTAEIISSAKGLTTCLKVRPRGAATGSEPAPVARLELVLPKIGVSLIAERTDKTGPAELLYLDLELLRVSACSRPEEDTQILDVALSDMQLDWQVDCDSNFAVVAGNRGASQHNLIRPFFRLVAERCRTSSPDLCISAARVELDELEVGANARFLTQVSSFLEDSVRELEVKRRRRREDGCALETVSRLVGVSLLEGAWTVPPRRKMLQVGRLHISPIVLHVWCRLRLSFLTFLPKWVKALITTLTLSQALALEGAALKLSQKNVDGATGSTSDFAVSLVREYIGDFLGSLGSVLGSSSLLNVPRAPLRLGGAVGGHAAGALSALTGGAAQAVEFMALDDEYVERQRAAREKKRISNVKEGLTAAISGIGDGLDGVLDIVRKPVAGAKKEGVGGFVKGIGQGVASAVVKPVSAVGGAVSDIGSGVAASAANVARHFRLLQKRRRPSRFLAGAFGAVVEYARLDAEVALALDSPSHDAVEAIVPLARVLVGGGGDGRSGDSGGGSNGAKEEEGREGTLLVLVLATASVRLVEIAAPRGDPNVEAEVAMLQRLASVPLERSGAVGRRDDGQATLSSHWSSQLPLKEVSWNEASEPNKPPEVFLQSARKTKFVAPMPWELSPELAQATFVVLQGLVEGTCSGDWAAPLRRELSRARYEALAESAGGGEVAQICTVWEVQRALAAAGSASSWKRPFLPTDSQQRNGWMDVGLKQSHPLLDPDAEPYDEKTAGDPPVVMMPIWTPSEDWHIVITEETDEHGWQYATDWAVSSWTKAPRPIFDTVRRRQWRRRYVLTASGEDGDDAAWLHEADLDEARFLGQIFRAMCCLSRPQAKPKRRARRGSAPTQVGVAGA